MSGIIDCSLIIALVFCLQAEDALVYEGLLVPA